MRMEGNGTRRAAGIRLSEDLIDFGQKIITLDYDSAVYHYLCCLAKIWPTRNLFLSPGIAVVCPTPPGQIQAS